MLPSALVQEALLRLLGDAPVEPLDRARFRAFSARIMRQVLVDLARAWKGGSRRLLIDAAPLKDRGKAEAEPLDFVDLDAALDELAELDELQAQAVELRYFGGLDNAAIAAVLRVPEPAVVRDWRMARTWLFGRLEPPGRRPEGPLVS